MCAGGEAPRPYRQNVWELAWPRDVGKTRVCGEKVQREDLQVPGFSGAVFEGQSTQMLCAAHWAALLCLSPTSQIFPLAPQGFLWQGAAAVTTWLKERHRGLGRDGGGRGSGGGCHFGVSFPAGSVIPSRTPVLEAPAGWALNLQLWRQRGWGRGLLFSKPEPAFLPVCKAVARHFKALIFHRKW